MYIADKQGIRGTPMDKRILVVDDDQAVRASLAANLTLAGYHVICAASGEAALGTLESCADTELAIIDVNMPGMDGLTLLEQIRFLFPQVKAIMLTGAPSSDVLGRAWQYGALATLVKPVSCRELFGKIEEAFAADCCTGCSDGIASP